LATTPFCLLFPGLVAWLDKWARWTVDKLEGLVNIVRGGFRGLIELIRDPVEGMETIGSYFGGCPMVRADAEAKTLVIAHRGCAGGFAENTIQSCSVALSSHANAIEVDLCYTADGKVVLWHDWDPDDVVALARHVKPPDNTSYMPRPPNIFDPWRRPVHELTLAQLREHYSYRHVDGGATPPSVDTTIPTFADLAEATKEWSNLRLLCLDIKTPTALVELAVPMIDKIHEQLPRERTFDVVVMVPRFAIAKAMKERSDSRGYGLTFSWDVEYPPGLILNPKRFSAIDHAVTPLNNRAATVGQPVSFFPWRTYRRTIAYDIERWNQVNADPGAENAGERIDHLIAWTINKPHELECLVSMGVSGIITDWPARLAAIVDKP
jgi:glycerophosphoryl diester phosphodiesterase